MKKSFLYITLIIISLLFCTKSTKAQFKDIFKYSTFYASGNIGAPFNANKQFYVNGTAGSGQLVETTDQAEFNYVVSIGLRKIARFDYQVKKGKLLLEQLTSMMV